MIIKKFFEKINFFRKKTPEIIPRTRHPISRKHISKNALKVLYRLHNHGYEAFLVGGCLRDVLLDREPKDFDIATNAHPEDIKALFKNCRLIGRRFRLAHIHFGSDILEVATFRGGAEATATKQTSEGMLLTDNSYGTLAEDVYRRDFTINALYYNIADYSLVDHVQARKDLKRKRLRLIGDPEVRYREDPVRMLRAIRFAVKLDLTIEKHTAKAMFSVSELLGNISAARLFEEFNKLFMSGYSVKALELLLHYQLFFQLFPQLEATFADEKVGTSAQALINLALSNTDERILSDQRASPGFILAILLWHPVMLRMNELKRKQKLPMFVALQQAMDDVLKLQQRSTAIPKRFSQWMRDVWHMQMRLANRAGKRAQQLFHSPHFRAAYDMLLLRAEVGEKEAIKLSRWWTDYQNADESTRWNMARAVKPEKKNKRKYTKNKTETKSEASETDANS